MELIKKTRLSKTNDVVDTLNYKMLSLQEQDVDVQTRLADYIYRGVSEVDNDLLQLKALKDEIKEREAHLKAQKASILSGSASFLLSNGIDKLEGNLVSSVTVNKGKDETTKQVFTLLVTKKESESFMIEAGIAVMTDVEVPKTHDTIRINKRKAGTVTVD